MNEVILKTDRRGRLRYTTEQKQVLIEAYQASGLSGPRFAALHGVNYQTLVSWLKKRRQGDADHPALRSLIPAELDNGSPRSATTLPMEILLPCGVRLAVHTPSQMNMAATLIRELHNPRSC
ncbi:MAG TPA: transposase [Desulfurivibrionaceae bacterium]|nr:transposase [Desulfurivibrionaceae bacterium]